MYVVCACICVDVCVVCYVCVYLCIFMYAKCLYVCMFVCVHVDTYLPQCVTSQWAILGVDLSTLLETKFLCCSPLHMPSWLTSECLESLPLPPSCCASTGVTDGICVPPGATGAGAGGWDSDSGPHTCKASALATVAPSPLSVSSRAPGELPDIRELAPGTLCA